mmetsp:Transcript_1209/g.1549  ORF Transcript_1209/g.1549 Transcript_1209/m.1549 type:complete len:173 (+) Transcript_1209:122-640(+)
MLVQMANTGTEDITLKGLIVTNLTPNDVLCSVKLCSKLQHPGNRRFAAFFAKNYSRFASSNMNKKEITRFLVSAFMKAPNGGRFLKPLEDSKHILLTRNQSVEFVYDSLQYMAMNANMMKLKIQTSKETRGKDGERFNVDSHVAAILSAQKRILMKMKREGKIKNNLASMCA